jgi:hypothetical protein
MEEPNTSELVEKTIKELYDLCNLKNCLLFNTVFILKKARDLLRFSVIFEEFQDFLSMENLIDYNNRELVNEIMIIEPVDEKA